MQHVVLCRPSMLEEGELGALHSNFPVVTSRVLVPSGSIIIGRYSVLPHYDELVSDLKVFGARLINTRAEHEYLADLGSYGPDLGDLTPITWYELSDVPRDAGPFVLKGQTNSKKFLWNTHMYAQNFDDAVKVYLRLTEDGLIGDQKIYIRKYVPLKKLGRTLSGTPITKEFRFFVLNNIIVGASFYWSAFTLDIVEQGGVIPSHLEVPSDFLHTAINRVRNRAPFYAMDVAQDESGRWWVIELNDGQMSGLSGVDPNTLYANMRRALITER